MGVVFFEEGEVDVYSHGEVPEGVGRYEPAGIVCEHICLVEEPGRRCKAYIWIKKPWNWQRWEYWPERMGDSDIRVATLQRVFPHDA